MPHVTTFLGAFSAWAIMAVAMMGPIAVVLSWRRNRSITHVGLALAGFIAVWVVVGIPVAALVVQFPVAQSAALTAAIIAIAAAYQFSQLHHHALEACMTVRDDSRLRYGFNVGKNCVVACGPLMVVAFWIMPSSIAPMIGLAVVMAVEFLSTHRIVLSRVVGLAGAVLAAGVLLLPGAAPEGPINVHVHH
ncbi:MAG: DUF2182 domain-containing protein [Actinomycetes bacterium]